MAQTSQSFDHRLIHASVSEPNGEVALAALKELRRECLHAKATRSAAKCLSAMFWLAGPAKLDVARRLVREAPSVESVARLALAARDAGKFALARRAYERLLAIANDIGDLDALTQATSALEAIRTSQKVVTFPERQFRSLVRKAISLARRKAPEAYAQLQKLRQSALRRGGRRTAIECQRGLVIASSYAMDCMRGTRFAERLAVEEPTSWSYLALAFAQEHCERSSMAVAAYETALRLARREGDLHRIGEASNGLQRTRGRRVSRGNGRSQGSLLCASTLVPYEMLKSIAGIP